MHLARRRLPAEVIERVSGLVESGMAATNQIVTAEVLIGSRNEIDFARNKEQFAGHVQFHITESTWVSATALGYRMLRLGSPGSLTDLLIATTAAEHGAVLVHADRGLDRIANFIDIEVESYADLA